MFEKAPSGCCMGMAGRECTRCGHHCSACSCSPVREEAPPVTLQMLGLSWDSGLSSRLGGSRPTLHLWGWSVLLPSFWRRPDRTLWRRDCTVCSYSLWTQMLALPRKWTDPTAGASLPFSQLSLCESILCAEIIGFFVCFSN